MHDGFEELLLRTTIFRRLSVDDRRRIALIATRRQFERGDVLFHEGDAPDELFTLTTGRVKIVKTTTRGTDVILEILGPGDPVGAVAVYESRPYPASAVALEPTTCVVLPGPALFELIEEHATLARGLLSGLTMRLVELTNRLSELSVLRVEARLARMFLKLAADMGQRQGDDSVLIPMVLSRQELADLVGTTIETSIRVMSRWGKDHVVQTDKEGFLIRDRSALEAISLG